MRSLRVVDGNSMGSEESGVDEQPAHTPCTVCVLCDSWQDSVYGSGCTCGLVLILLCAGLYLGYIGFMNHSTTLMILGCLLAVFSVVLVTGGVCCRQAQVQAPTGIEELWIGDDMVWSSEEEEQPILFVGENLD